VAIGKRKMKMYLDSSYLQKPKHRRVFLQAADFFAYNENLRGRLIIIVSPFAAEEGYGRIHANADRIAKGLYLVALSCRTANDVSVLRPRGLRVLFHELEHVRQFHEGELQYNKNETQLIWKGASQKNVPYEEQEFEIMANRAGRVYADDFLSVFPTDLRRGVR
jgi:hypothetical protein